MVQSAFSLGVMLHSDSSKQYENKKGDSPLAIERLHLTMQQIAGT